MAVVAPTPISALPTPPVLSDLATFSTRTDAFINALPTFRNENNTVASNVYSNAVDAQNNANTATAKAAEAVAASSSATATTGIVKWTSGVSYTDGAVVWSPLTYLAYRKRGTGSTITDPSLDSTSYTCQVQFGPPVTSVTNLVHQAASANHYLMVGNRNTLNYSEQLGTWGLYQSGVSPNDGMSPAGTMTADKIYGANGVSGWHSINQGVNVIAGRVYTFSAFLKSAEYTKADLTFNSTNGAFVITCVSVDLSAGTVAIIAGSPISYGIVPIGGGWYRAWVSGTALATVIGYPSITIWNGTPSFTGDGSSGVYAWGAQWEEGSVMSAYSPTTTAFSIGQGAATNLLLNSEQIGSWGYSGITIDSNVATAPNGTLTGDKIVETNAPTTSHSFNQGVSGITASTPYTLSIYAKAAERTEVILGFDNSGAYATAGYQYGRFNLSTGVASVFLGSPVLSITYVGDGWYRCTVGATASNSGTASHAVQLLNGSGTNVYTGTLTYGAYVWGAQLELGIVPTSYIPTDATQVTRAAGVIYPMRLILPPNPANNDEVWVTFTNGAYTNTVMPTNGTSIYQDRVNFVIDSGVLSTWKFKYMNDDWKTV